MRVQRPASSGLFGVNLAVVMGIFALKDFRSAAENGEGIHQRVFVVSEIGIQTGENLSVEAHACRSALRPAAGWPRFFRGTGVLRIQKNDVCIEKTGCYCGR